MCIGVVSCPKIEKFVTRSIENNRFRCTGEGSGEVLHTSSYIGYVYNDNSKAINHNGTQITLDQYMTTYAPDDKYIGYAHHRSGNVYALRVTIKDEMIIISEDIYSVMRLPIYEVPTTIQRPYDLYIKKKYENRVDVYAYNVMESYRTRPPVYSGSLDTGIQVLFSNDFNEIHARQVCDLYAKCAGVLIEDSKYKLIFQKSVRTENVSLSSYTDIKNNYNKLTVASTPIFTS
jgi:hypothetical protein